MHFEDCVFIDHKFIKIEININTTGQTVTKKRKVKIKRINYITFRKEVEKSINANNENITIEELIKIINNAKQKAIYWKNVRIKKEYSWLNQNILNKMEERDILYKRMKRNPLDIIARNNFKQCKNQVNNMIKAAKRKFISKQIEIAGKDSRKLWNVINKDILNKKLDTVKMQIEKIDDEDWKSYSNNRDIANAFNNYFTNVGVKLKNNIKPNMRIDNDITQRTIYLYPVTIEEISTIIRDLKEHAAPGIHEITVKDILLIEYIIISIITNCINDMLDVGIYPDCLKKALIVPVYKAGDRNKVFNYRPISLLSTLAKIYEKLLSKRIHNFIIQNCGYDINQFGFQPNSGTESVAVQVIDQVNTGLDSNKYVCAVFIDLQKAFDTVDHELLIEFLEQLGMRGVCSNIIRSYLTNREIVTKVNDEISNKAVLKVGVPQGSVLGPLFYLLYINNLRKMNLAAKYTIYADDTCLLYAENNCKELEKCINEDLKYIRNGLMPTS